MLWHLTIATEGRLRLFEIEAAVRRAVQAIVRVADEALLLFCVVDDHVHVVLKATRRRVGHIAGGLSLTLRSLGSPPLASGRIRPVRDRRHLESLVGYLVRQPDHHGLEWGALWGGSCFLDLVGARVLLDVRRIAAELPRVDLVATALGGAGLDLPRLDPATDEQVRLAGPAEAWASVLAAAGIDDGIGRSERVVAARVAWRRLAADVGWNRVAREAASIPERNWERHAHVAADPRLVEAARRRICLESHVRATRAVNPPDLGPGSPSVGAPARPGAGVRGERAPA